MLSWLTERAAREKMPVKVYTDAPKHEPHFITVFISVGGKKDAVSKAHLMQKIEDEWNYGKPRPNIKLLLIPTRHEANLEQGN